MPRRAAPKFLPLPALTCALCSLCVLFVLALALPALAGLKKAEAAGLSLTGELRFLSVNGQLVTRNLEDVLREEGRLAPVFDLDKGARTAK